MNTMRINFRKVQAKELAMTYHRPANIGAVITFVIIYKNLHDHYQFGRKRFAYIMEQFDRYQKREWGLTQKEVNEVVTMQGLNEQLYNDYMHHAAKMAEIDDTYSRILDKSPVTSKRDREEYNEAAEIAYKVCMLILCRYLKFGKKRLNDLQRYMKADMWCILEKRVKIIEFMNMLHESCAQNFGALDDWMKKYHRVYGEDGMPL